ncbi:hypothetical protein AS9A_0027 [Hoyosella subflava DQS3-9A1]|uniref:Low molecular weight protein antigen 6 PH domain-containing protein n=1 Tax=Hoyosella subflava (strain DSM 45089 / JCM 17490 / NBRC 109087 / DQS3-9A1) TaxID=443218 RepID=F6ERG7_HOYSD|nr:hypothetical protein AS9A_0027 [Hoyosella subflava DQS3-9A1]
MDNRSSFPQGVEELEWSPRPAALGVAAAGGITLSAVAVVLRAEPAGLFLTGLAALLLIGIAVAGSLARPRLAIRKPDDSDNPLLVFRSFLGKQHTLRESEIERVHIVRYPRWGRRVPMLEIELAPPSDRLIILSRWDLGTEPLDVAHTLARHGVRSVDISPGAEG